MQISSEDLALLWPKIKTVHFIGITSPFSSFCASVLRSRGVTVTASEQNQDSESAKEWISAGVLIPGPHNSANITSTIDLVIFPNAALPGNPEVEQTIATNIPFVYIQQLLGFLSKGYKTIAIAGTHGKTTTTAIIIWLLHKTLGTPNFIVGDAKDRIAELDKNWNINPQSEYLVLEACEYKKQFLERAPQPFISVITHIDLDHTDFYHSQAEYNKAFEEFLTPTVDTIIIDASKENEKAVLSAITGVKANIINTHSIKVSSPRIESPLFGQHNQENLIRALAVGSALNIPETEVRKALATFPGISSRFEFKGKTKHGTPVYKDFAHNPQKVRSCLAGAKEAFPTTRLIALYQPHNHERTSSFRHELVNALELADCIMFPNIYSIRETEQDKALISATEFYTLITEKYPNKQVIFTEDLPPYNKTLQQLNDIDGPNSLIVIMSAGDVDKIIPELIQ
jgi:UDP-N-acetylmuramate--alanine ligase